MKPLILILPAEPWTREYKAKNTQKNRNKFEFTDCVQPRARLFKEISMQKFILYKSEFFERFQQ